MDASWTEWKGGDVSPVAEQAEVEVILRDGSSRCASAGEFVWFWDDYPATDIVRYRLTRIMEA